MKIIVDEKFLEKFGTGTLIGMCIDNKGEFPKEITLAFPYTSSHWKSYNGGPDMLLMYEHVLLCWTECIVVLVGRGVVVKTEFCASPKG